MNYRKESTAIRPLTKEDVGPKSKYRSWFEDPEVTVFTSHGLFPFADDEVKVFMKRISAGNTDVVWAIVGQGNTPHGKPTKHIGNIGLHNIDWVNRKAEIAIIIGEKDSWGKGHAARAIEMVLSHARQQLGLHRVWAGTAEANLGFVRAAQKAGMVSEAVLVQDLWISGEWMNTVRMAAVWGEV